MSLLILTSKSLKTLTDTDLLKLISDYNVQLLITDLALHNLQAESAFNTVKDFIDRSFITVINTILIDKIDQYINLSVNPEECSIRNLIDIYAEKDITVTILVDEDWCEMRIDNIQILSIAKFLNSNQVINSGTPIVSQLSAEDSNKKSEFKIIHPSEDHYKKQEKDD